MVAFLFILTIGAFIVIDVVRTRRAERRATAGAVAAAPAYAMFAPLLIPTPERYAVPAGVFVHKGHTWAHLDVSGNAKVGIDEFARGIIGRIDRVDSPAPGSRVAQGEKLFSVRQGKERIDFVAPLSGVVREVNEEAGIVPSARPVWLLSLEPTNLVQEIKRLRIASETTRWLDGEMRRFAEFLAAHVPRPLGVGATLPDGGVHIDGIFEELDEASRIAFVKGFLR